MIDNQLDDGGPAFPADIQRRNPMTGDWLEPPPQGMTLRAYAAIKLRVPESGFDWLDAMIVKAKRDEFAGMVMQGFMARPGLSDTTARFALTAYQCADAMLAERKRGAE